MPFPNYVAPVVRHAIHAQCLRQIEFFQPPTLSVDEGINLFISPENQEYCKQAFLIFNRNASSHTYHYELTSNSGHTNINLYIDCRHGGKVLWPDKVQRPLQDTPSFHNAILEWVEWVDECIEKWALVRGLFDAFVQVGAHTHLKYAWPDFHLLFDRISVSDGKRVVEWWNRITPTSPGRFDPPVPDCMDHLEEARRTVLANSITETPAKIDAPVRCRIGIEGKSFERYTPWGLTSGFATYYPKKVDLMTP